MDATQIIEIAKQKAGSRTDAALAARLGVTKQAVSNWKKSRSLPDTVTCEKLAEISGLPLNQVLGIVGEARAISVAEKRVWRKLAAAMFVSAVLLPVTSFASNFPTNGNAELDIMRNYVDGHGWLGCRLDPSSTNLRPHPLLWP